MSVSMDRGSASSVSVPDERGTMSTGYPPVTPLRGDSAFLGRDAELVRLEAMLSDARRGTSRALVISGEPGVGKSALLERLASSATDCTVARAAGVPAEAEIAFASLHQLCLPLLGHLDDLPEPQRKTLATTFGLETGPTPDPFLLGVSVLGVLAAAAAERPLLCAVDDAQWIDSSSARVLGFITRRLVAESVAIVFTRRDDDRPTWLTGTDEFALEGLPRAAAIKLLATVIPGPLDPLVRDRIIAETRGNPLAILELPPGLTTAELAGGFGLTFGGRLSERIEGSFYRRLAELPSDGRRFMLLAAAEPLGDPSLLLRAAGRLGLDTAPVDELAGLLRWGTPVTFRHPLARSATYRAASPEDLRTAHRALADVTDPVADPDRRAWHLAQATADPDERVALYLERSAGRAQARGGFAAAAAFLERAAVLSPDPARGAERALAAAEAKHRGGASEAALSILERTPTGLLDDEQRARVDLVRARAASVLKRGADATHLLLQAAKRLKPLDEQMARDTHLEALSAAQFAGRLAPGLIAAAADAARRAPAPPTGRRSQDDLLTGLAALLIDGYVQGAPLVQSALARFRDDDLTDEDILRWSWIACRAAAYVWDFDNWQALSSRMVTLARHAGALSILPLGLPFQMVQCALAGRMDQVKALADEVNAIAEATRLTPVPYGVLQCSAWQGRPAEAIPLIDTVAHQAAARGEGLGVTVAHMSRAILLNGLGRHEEALAAAVAGSEHPEDLVFHNWSLVELIEAASHVRQPERAAEAFERLAVRTSAAGGAWALGVEARCRALISGHDDAERLYRESIALLEQTQVRTETARSYLLLGEWLRRQRRRVEARQVLRRAHDLFTSMGLEAFAERAGRELAATGERARRRTIETNTNLTPRELQVARMASEGLSNPEIGIRLYLSTRTVEYHLRKVFTKLGISSRVQLSNALELSAGEVADR